MTTLDQAAADLIAAPQPILFLDTFAAPNATVFHPDIVPDAAAAGLRYSISLEAAVADLRTAGEIP